MIVIQHCRHMEEALAAAMLNVEHGETVFDHVKSGESGKLERNPDPEPLFLEVRGGMRLRVRPREGRVSLIPFSASTSFPHGYDIIVRVREKYLSAHTDHLSAQGVKGCGHHFRITGTSGAPGSRKYFDTVGDPAMSGAGGAFTWWEHATGNTHNPKKSGKGKAPAGKCQTLEEHISDVSHIVCMMRPEFRAAEPISFASLKFVDVRMAANLVLQRRPDGEIIGGLAGDLPKLVTNLLSEFPVNSGELASGLIRKIEPGVLCNSCRTPVAAWCAVVMGAPECYGCASVFICNTKKLSEVEVAWCPPTSASMFFAVDVARQPGAANPHGTSAQTCWESADGSTLFMGLSVPASTSTSDGWWWDRAEQVRGRTVYLITHPPLVIDVP
jgi:hypothetical protein